MTGNKGDVERRATASGADRSPQASQGEGAQRRRIASLAGALALLPLCLCYAWNTLRDYADFWAHAAIGRWIVGHGHPPTHTLFLWTWHGRYIAHSWLSETIIYLLIRHLSDDGAATFALLSAGVLGFLAFAILWRLFEVSTRTVCAAVSLFSLAIAAEAARLLPRPEIATVVLLALLLSLLVARHRDGGATRIAENAPSPTPSDSGADDLRADVRLGLLLIAMFIVWTNLHGGMATGLIVLWIAAIADVVQDRGSVRSVRFVAIAALCTVATLINPYGYHYYSIYHAVSTVMFRYIMEWKPMYVLPLMPDSTRYSLAILFVVGLVTWAKGSPYAPVSSVERGRGKEADSPFARPAWRPGRWAHLVWLLAFFVMTMQARRNVGFMALVSLAVAAPYFRAWSAGRISPERSSEPQSKRKRPARPAEREAGSDLGWLWRIVAVIVYLTILANAYIDMGSQPAPALLSTMTGGMTGFVKQNGIRGHIFNDYDTSMFMEWRLGPDGPEIYVDGNNAYPDQVFLDYLDIRNATPRGIRLLDQQGIDCVLGNAQAVSRICRYVAASPQWALAYNGVDGPVWVRRVPQYRSLWDGVPTWQGVTPREYLEYLRTDAHEEEQ